MPIDSHSNMFYCIGTLQFLRFDEQTKLGEYCHEIPPQLMEKPKLIDQDKH